MTDQPPANQPPAKPTDATTEQLRIRKAFWLALGGLVLAALLVVFLVLFGWKTASDITAVVGLFTSVLGTLVGAFFGLQIGASDKAKAEDRASSAERNLASLLGVVDSSRVQEATLYGFDLRR